MIRLPANGFIRWTSEMLFPTLMRIGSWFPYQALHLNLSTHRFLRLLGPALSLWHRHQS